MLDKTIINNIFDFFKSYNCKYINNNFEQVPEKVLSTKEMIFLYNGCNSFMSDVIEVPSKIYMNFKDRSLNNHLLRIIINTKETNINSLLIGLEKIFSENFKNSYFSKITYEYNKNYLFNDLEYESIFLNEIKYLDIYTIDSILDHSFDNSYLIIEIDLGRIYELEKSDPNYVASFINEVDKQEMLFYLSKDTLNNEQIILERITDEISLLLKDRYIFFAYKTFLRALFILNRVAIAKGRDSGEYIRLRLELNNLLKQILISIKEEDNE